MSTPQPPSRPGRRRPRTGALVLAAFLVVPIVELAIAVQVGRWIGVGPTILLLVFESALGAWIVRREGAAAWRALNVSLQSGRPPTRELADAALVLIGGTLLLTPGFLTDIVGFALMFPVTRAPARRLLTRWLARSVARRMTARTMTFGGGVVPGEVIREAADDGDDERKGRPPR